MKEMFMTGSNGAQYGPGTHATIVHDLLGEITGEIIDISPSLIYFRKDGDELIQQLSASLIKDVKGVYTPPEYDIMVDHPPHYRSETGLETIDVIEAFTFDLSGIEAVCTANVLKYMCRWKSKNGVQDLKKAKWYLEHLIAHIKKLEEENTTI